ncbi:MAG: dicarboxylate/amino acid:cation symporter [Oscillospiraceae bacterium]
MKDSLIVKLVLAVALGIGIGLVANREVMVFMVTLRYILGQIIFFCVPLIIIGFIAPSITKLKGNASRLLSVAVALAYVSSVLAAAMSATAGYAIIPHLNISAAVEGLKELPGVFFNLDIPPLMSVMSALAFSLMLGLAVSWTKSEKLEGILDEFQNVILSIVTKIVIPLLPFFIGCTFSGFAYDGSITKQLPVFIVVILVVLVGHFIWMGVLFTVAGLYSGKNPSRVFRHYGPAYLTAVGTMSSAATLPVTLTCARKSDVLRPDIIDFSIPLFTNIHLCGSVLTEVFFVMTVSQILYGSIPSVGNMALFIVLLGIFAIGAPGVPGGTVMASLGLITGVLGFGEEGTALMLTIFALQDSFGTACNVTGDGALALILSGYADRKGIKAN